ncbi:putative E3 ubiquitin-protein ligase SINAT1 [Sitophilus oryzae]|uniref:RING-type E3 ubiquitin transferase n=1 Tax=Sitophilus oryzae TaxID=7048 RepID=A0A6J2XKP0_SITOR|nr:putative E3 ubiquitin-protein ligase SINAT1 [Sitophilus oryzae]
MQETDKKYNVFIAMDGSEIESQCFKYHVDILNTDKNTYILLKKNCLYSLEDFEHSLNIPEKQLVLNYENIFELLEKPKRLIMKFGIFKKSKKEILKITGFKDSELFKEKHIENTFFPKTDDNLLRELECPICSEYMLPPIYMCATGHGICSFCRNNITSCPTCRSKITDNRSFILENLISKINFPCRNREAGCKFVGASDNIKAHQKNCSFRISCMLCDWEGALYDFHIHLLTDHQRHILEQNVYHTANFFDTFIGFLYVYNQVFCAIFRPSNLKCPTELSLSVSITHISMDTENPNFKYELKFNPASCNNNSICFSNIPCIGISCKDFKIENLGNLDCGILIPYNLLKIYTNEEKYGYKIFIKKM